MQRLYTIFATCLLSGAMAFAQGSVTPQSPANDGRQANTVNTSANANGTTPGTQANPGNASSNQALPGDSNPANAATRDGSANAQATRPDQANGAAARTTGDNGNNNGMATDPNGNNPASGRDANRIVNPGTAGSRQWLWIALGIVIGLVLISMLVSRNRPETTIDSRDRVRPIDDDRDQMRRVG